MTVKELLKYFLVWQTAILCVSIVAIFLLPARPDYMGGSTELLLNSRANFDGYHFLRIATKGYDYGRQVFFPLYPLLISYFNHVFKSPVVSGVFVSMAAFLVGLHLFYKLIRLDHSPRVAHFTIIALLFFPVSFYFSFVYSEGLFFCLLIASFYAARTNRWLQAGILGALASYTRFVGIFLFPALLFELWPKKNLINLVCLLLIPLGLVTYMYQLHKTTGDALAFVHMQKNFGDYRSEKVVLLPQVFWRYTKMLTSINHFDPLYATITLEFMTGVVFLPLTIVSFFKFRKSYALYSFLAYLLPTLTGNFVSLPRYVLVCFPAFVLIGDYLSRHGQAVKPYLLANGALFVIYLSLFSRGYWVG